MKQNFHFIALLIILLLFSSKFCACYIATKKGNQTADTCSNCLSGQEEVKLKEATSEVSVQQMEESKEIVKLMGIEVCDNGDEECLKRRIISEAHLDYIYTQHHKP